VFGGAVPVIVVDEPVVVMVAGGEDEVLDPVELPDVGGGMVIIGVPFVITDCTTVPAARAGIL
jgi:hypothetical protein